MRISKSVAHTPRIRGAGVAIAIAVLLAGCAATSAPTPKARVEVQDDVGFTITEESNIGGDVRADYDQAVALLQQGRQEDGVTLLATVADAAPGLSAPRIDLGIAYHRAGDLDAAINQLQQALTSNPDHPIAHNELGIIFRKQGRFAESRQSYEAALAIYPKFHYARRNLAILCDLYMADLNCALENYEAYMAAVPDDNEASMWIVDLRNRLGK